MVKGRRKLKNTKACVEAQIISNSRRKKLCVDKDSTGVYATKPFARQGHLMRIASLCNVECSEAAECNGVCETCSVTGC